MITQKQRQNKGFCLFAHPPDYLPRATLVGLQSGGIALALAFIPTLTWVQVERGASAVSAKENVKILMQ